MIKLRRYREAINALEKVIEKEVNTKIAPSLLKSAECFILLGCSYYSFIYLFILFNYFIDRFIDLFN